MSDDQTVTSAEKPAEKPTPDGWRTDAIEWAKTIVGAFAVYLAFTTVAFANYRIPSESMVPHLEVGDRVVVSKFAYGYSRFSLPFDLGRLLPRERTSLVRSIAAARRRGRVRAPDQRRGADQARRRPAGRHHRSARRLLVDQRRARANDRRDKRDAACPIQPAANLRSATKRRCRTATPTRCDISHATAARSTISAPTLCPRATSSSWATTATIRSTAARAEGPRADRKPDRPRRDHLLRQSVSELRARSYRGVPDAALDAAAASLAAHVRVRCTT